MSRTATLTPTDNTRHHFSRSSSTMFKIIKSIAVICGLSASLWLGHGAAWAADAAAPTEAATSQSAPAPAQASAAGEASTDNPYGLGALWAQGDAVAKGTLLILVLMSMGSWYVIVTKFFEQNRNAGFARKARCARARTNCTRTALTASSLRRAWKAPASMRACWAPSTSTPGSR